MVENGILGVLSSVALRTGFPLLDEIPVSLEKLNLVSRQILHRFFQNSDLIRKLGIACSLKPRGEE